MNELKSSEDYVDVVFLPRVVYDKLLSDSVKLNLIRDSIRNNIDTFGPSGYGLVNSDLILDIAGMREYLRMSKDLERKEAAT